MRRLTITAGTLLIVAVLAAPAGAATGSGSPQRAGALVSHPRTYPKMLLRPGKIRHTRIVLHQGKVTYG
jgi:hypothetical protein